MSITDSDYIASLYKLLTRPEITDFTLIIYKNSKPLDDINYAVTFQFKKDSILTLEMKYRHDNIIELYDKIKKEFCLSLNLEI